MDRTHRAEELSTDEEPSRGKELSSDSDSSTDSPRIPYAQRVREKVDQGVPTKPPEAADIRAREARDHAKRQRWNPQNQRRGVQDPKPEGNRGTDITEREARDHAKRLRWVPKDGQQDPPSLRPQWKRKAKTSRGDSLERKERQSTGDKVKASTDTGGQSKGIQDSSASSSTWNEIAPRLTRERAMKTALGEFCETLNMYLEMDQKYDGK